MLHTLRYAVPTANTSASRGFTIVELLIVIIVIGILAAIIIVAYNGVTNKAHTSAAQAAAATVAKKIEAFNAQNGYYPTYLTVGTLTSQLSADPTYSLTNSGLTIDYTGITPGNGASHVQVRFCNAVTAPANNTTPTGYKVYYWDYAAGALATANSGGSTAACSTSTSGS